VEDALERVGSREMNSNPSPSVPGRCVSSLARVETERTDDAERPLEWDVLGRLGVRDMPLMLAAESRRGRLSESIDPARRRDPSCRATPSAAY